MCAIWKVVLKLYSCVIFGSNSVHVPESPQSICSDPKKQLEIMLSIGVKPRRTLAHFAIAVIETMTAILKESSSACAQTSARIELETMSRCIGEACHAECSVRP